MAAITLRVNPDGTVSPGLLMVPGPLPTLDGQVVRPAPAAPTENQGPRETIPAKDPED